MPNKQADHDPIALKRFPRKPIIRVQSIDLLNTHANVLHLHGAVVLVNNTEARANPDILC